MAFIGEITNLEVIDVPGNHYTLLHQKDEDMVVMLEQLQTTLSSHGIGEMAKARKSNSCSRPPPTHPPTPNLPTHAHPREALV